MRSSRVPARTASTTARTAARTSSSPSEAVSTVVRSAATGTGLPMWAAPLMSAPRRCTDASTSASAAGMPLTPAMTVVGTTWASSRSSRAPWRVSR